MFNSTKNYLSQTDDSLCVCHRVHGYHRSTPVVGPELETGGGDGVILRDQQLAECALRQQLL